MTKKTGLELLTVTNAYELCRERLRNNHKLVDLFWKSMQ